MPELDPFMVASNRDLRRRGYPQADIDLAERQREAERRAGGPVRSLTEVLAGLPARPRPDAPPADLTARQLRRRGRYGQAALLADQAALTEKCAQRTSRAREAAGILKELAARPAQTEFDFFMANTSIGHQFLDTVLDRLKRTGAPASEQRTALAALGVIIRWLAWESYECQKNAAELAELLAMDRSDMTRTLQLLERVGAIVRVKRRQMKIITLTPEGAYRGDINRHAEAVDRYKAEVLPLRRPVPPARKGASYNLFPDPPDAA